MRIVLAAFLAVALSNTAFAQALSGSQIRQALVGHTINGVENGESYSEYLNPDGTISGKGKDGEYSGKWRIDDDELCFLYEEGKDWDCNEVKLRGNQITWDDGTTATVSGPDPARAPRAKP